MGSCERVAGVLGDFGDYELLEEITTRTTDLDPLLTKAESEIILQDQRKNFTTELQVSLSSLGLLWWQRSLLQKNFSKDPYPRRHPPPVPAIRNTYRDSHFDETTILIGPQVYETIMTVHAIDLTKQFPTSARRLDC